MSQKRKVRLESQGGLFERPIVSKAGAVHSVQSPGSRSACPYRHSFYDFVSFPQNLRLKVAKLHNIFEKMSEARARLRFPPQRPEAHNLLECSWRVVQTAVVVRAFDAEAKQTSQYRIQI